ncbi:amidohydrolase [Vibrio galatheae]|uniref:Amidohydrolase n=1 Tax=Vibrio galatheae TaxID=579748 RepID=A0A0F4NL11_9VIBR|nr:carbon-nitrogen hydrolase family protein [Vibrio galatheae]KJY83880.1 amidohydrolase [Vibrio galatheae]
MNTGVTISLAQIPVARGDLSGNLNHHFEMIERSSKHNADVVVFPELSLTGYELDLASELAELPEPANFKQLSQAAIENDIIVIAGCPLTNGDDEKPTIGAVVCFPDGTVEFYSKQHLHVGEDEYCSSGSEDYSFTVNGHQIALAICADFTKQQHSRQAKTLGADIYVVSALISDSGFETDSKILSTIALEQGFPVVLSNHISMTGGWASCGDNSIWDSTGKLVMSSNSKESCLVLCKIAGDEIKAIRL